MRLSFNKKCPIGHFTSIWNERLLMVIAARLLAYKVAVDVAPAVDNKTLYDSTGKVVYGWNQLSFSSSRAVQSVNSYKKMLEGDHNTYQQGRHRGSMCKDGTNKCDMRGRTGLRRCCYYVCMNATSIFPVPGLRCCCRSQTQDNLIPWRVWYKYSNLSLLKKLKYSPVSQFPAVNLLGIILKWHCKFSI